MRDFERSPSLHPGKPRITRRRLVGVTSAALAAPLAPAAAQEERGERGDSTPVPGTPIASPAAAVPVDIDALLAVSVALVGVDSLKQDAARPLAQLIGADPGRAAGFEELTQVDDLAADGSLDGLSDDAASVARNILQYWYMGYFDGQPVENRETIFFGLPVWQTLPYATQPTLCKGFGYWATDPGVEG